MEGAKMELKYLAEFSMLAHCGNFSLAADELFISQACLSKHIKALEQELGVQLFERTTRSVHLSDYGNILLPFAQEVSVQFERLAARLEREKEHRHNALQIASIPVMAQYGITQALYAFRIAHPEIKFSVSEQEGSRIDELIEKGDFDLAFKRLSMDFSPDPSYTELVYCTDELVAVLPENHMLAKASTVTLTDLRNDTFLLMDENTLIYDICMKSCRKAGFEPKTQYKGHRPENILGLVAQGMGISLLMKRQAEFYKNPGIVTIALTDHIVSRISLVYKQNRVLPPTAGCFVRFLKEYLERMESDAESSLPNT